MDVLAQAFISIYVSICMIYSTQKCVCACLFAWACTCPPNHLGND